MKQKTRTKLQEMLRDAKVKMDKCGPEKLPEFDRGYYAGIAKALETVLLEV